MFQLDENRYITIDSFSFWTYIVQNRFDNDLSLG